ncbi:MAG: hypothetical protein KDK99_19955, partial [Verrucomicrobiales bacterium]|nr:hypothetical protein [Verrucomicrobiales bacterium]
TTYRIAVDGFYTSPYWEMGSYKLVVSRLAASAPLASSEDQPWVGTPSAAPAPAGQVVLGGNGQEADLVWLPSSAAADSDCLEARARLSWVAEEGSRDQFGIIAYDTAEEPMFGVNVSTADGSVSLLHPDSHTSRTEQTLISDEAQDITLHLDQDRGTWRASLNGVWIGDEQPIPEGRTFAEMGAQWLPGHGGGRSAVVLQEAEVTAGDHAAP